MLKSTSSGSSSSSKIKAAISEWSAKVSIDDSGGAAPLMMPAFAAEVPADLITVVKTLMAHKASLLLKS
jgi:hypothetical protein